MPNHLPDRDVAPSSFLLFLSLGLLLGGLGMLLHNDYVRGFGFGTLSTAVALGRRHIVADLRRAWEELRHG